MKFNLVFTLLLLVTNIYANVNDGKQVYLVHCANCHGNNMNGGEAKDFNLVSYERTKDDIKNYVTQPDNFYKSFGYSANAMPTLPLTGKEIEDIVDYIDSLQPFKKAMIINN